MNNDSEHTEFKNFTKNNDSNYTEFKNFTSLKLKAFTFMKSWRDSFLNWRWGVWACSAISEALVTPYIIMATTERFI